MGALGSVSFRRRVKKLERVFDVASQNMVIDIILNDGAGGGLFGHMHILISSCEATMLQLLKETGMRLGEAFQLDWKDIDFERNLVTVNHPEKGSNARILRISRKLADMLAMQPKGSQRTFGEGSIKTFESNFWKQRKNAARKLQNPRLLSISYHTFRHWKATMEYHKTHDIFHVQRLLGHKNIQNTSIYITLENNLFETDDTQFHTSVAQTVEEARKLLEVGFEFVLDMNGTSIFRKRK